jgi:enoyl-[acyl-carrier protein] reductase I
MGPGTPGRTLEGKKGLVLGIANRHSIAYGCAKAFHALGAGLGSPTSTTKLGPSSSRWRKS